jgi:putative ABC transport system substrate-binding protein
MSDPSNRAHLALPALATVCSLLVTLPTWADQPRIAVLAPSVPNSPQETGLREGLRQLGYIEGKDISIDWINSPHTNDEFRLRAADAVRSKPDLIVAFGTPAARAVLDATSTIPVVFYVGDPVATGLASSLAHPEGNATGISVLSTELTAKRLDLLHQLVPRARRIVYLINPSNPLTARLLQEAQDTSRKLGLQLMPIGARNAEELDLALSKVRRGHADGVLVTDAFFVAERVKVVKVIRASRLPAMFGWKEDQEDGVLISYGPSFREGARRVAAYVDKVLRGSKPSQLPIEQDATYELIINLRVAR